jgi:hypothetical protein
MAKALKFLLLGTAIGGAVVALKAKQSSEPVDDLPVKAAKSAGLGGLAGFVVGFALDRRSKRTQAKRRRKLAPVVAATGIAGAARAAVPAIEHTRRKARKAAQAAAKQASKRAKKAGRKAGKAAGAARDRAETLVDAGRQKLAS